MQNKQSTDFSYFEGISNFLRHFLFFHVQTKHVYATKLRENPATKNMPVINRPLIKPVGLFKMRKF